MINNLDLIRGLLKFDESGDTYYYVQIIKRRKDNPSLNRSEVKISSIFLTNKNDLDKYWNDFIKERADSENARVYISINPRSLQKFTGLCLMEYSKRVLNNSFAKSWRVPDSCAISKDTIKRGFSDIKSWILDVDNPDSVESVKEFISGYTKIIQTIPTPNGYHIAVSPFNYRRLDSFRTSMSDNIYIFGEEKRHEFCLKMEGNTVLYAP